MKRFKDFMEEALRAYYGSDKKKIGPQGDFFTAPELDYAFGRAVAEFIEPLLSEFENPAILELGAGKGLMAYDILTYFGEKGIHPTYYIYEFSPYMIQRQREILKNFKQVKWVQELPEISGVVISNEFFDALPVHVVKQGRELYITQEGKEIWQELEDEEVLEFLEIMDYTDIQHRIEVCLECIKFLKKIADALMEGYNLVIDYGYTSQEINNFPEGTVVSYSKHKLDTQVLKEAGSKDITAHVNFSALIEFGNRYGLETVLFQNQRDFLTSIPGFLMELERLSSSDNPQDIERLSRLKTLLISMGDRFKVLLQRKG